MESAIVALWLPTDLASLLASVAREALGDAAEPAERLHLTLTYLGEAASEAGFVAAGQALQFAVEAGLGLGGVDARISGVGRFTAGEDGQTAIYVSVDSPVLSALQQELAEHLIIAGWPPATRHGFTPHITLGYCAADAPMPELPLIELPLLFTSITLAWGERHLSIPFRAPGGDDDDLERVPPFAAVKASLGAGGEWILDALGVPFGSPAAKDTHGEWFSEATQFHEDKYDILPPAVYYHGAGPDGRPLGRPEYIGRTIKRWRTKAGIWFRVILDQANQYARRVWDAARCLAARASSGSISHLARVARTGEIIEWPGPVELSLFDIDPAAGRVPASNYAVVIPAVKALYQQAGKALPKGVLNVDEEELKRQIAAAVAAALEKERTERTEREAQAQAEQARIDAAVKAAMEARDAEDAGRRRLPSGGGGAPHVRQFAETAAYDNLDLADQAYLIGLVNSKPGQRASSAAYKAVYIKAAEAKTEAGERVRAAAKAAGLDLSDATSATKANELMHTTQAGYGDEWVGIAYSTQLWEAVRAPTMIPGMIPEIVIPQGSESVYDPLEGADPTFYKVAETTGTNATTGRPDATITASKAGTDRKLHTATKMGARVIWPGEMDENSLIPVAPQLRRQLDTATQEILEHVIIDGDTDLTANTNINNIAGTPAGTEVWTSFNGLRKLALITNTANARDGGVISEDDFIETLKLMGTAGLLGADVQKVLYIIDANVNWKILTLASVKTRDVFLNATIENGVLTSIFGRRIYTSFQMHRASAKRMANTAGKIHATDSNNTTGAILGWRPDQWKLARKRRVTFETSRWPESDANQIVVTFSAGLQYRDAEAAAASYNLTI